MIVVYLGASHEHKILKLVRGRRLTASAVAGREAGAPGGTPLCITDESGRDLWNRYHTLLHDIETEMDAQLDRSN